MTHLLGMTAATACITLCTFLPFLPGRYDPLAAPLSLMAQILATAGLLLVPSGALLTVSAYWSWLATKRRAFSIAALVAASFVWLIVSLGALVSSGPALGVTALALGAYIIFRVSRRLKAVKGATPGRASATPLYLIVVPIAATILQVALAEPATEFSRGRAIRNSASLIADIERYRASNGRYPTSLLSLWEDYSPSVIGIKDYRYEPSGDAYNLCFEQVSFVLGTREIVMYNPRDEQVMTSHNMDLLRRTREELALRRGYYAVHDAPQPHWKYFWFD